MKSAPRSFAVGLVLLSGAYAFRPTPPMQSPMRPTESLSSSTTTSNNRFHRDVVLQAASSPDSPPLRRHPPRKVCLMVEPTPFTHVSGYANRFKEMLKFLKKAGDDVDILTVDSKTPAKELPKSFVGYPIRHTQGFTFPLYNHISLTIDLPEMKGAQIIEEMKPDLIHVTSPGFLVFAAIFYARVMCIPLVMSYHTHLPTYGASGGVCLCVVCCLRCRPPKVDIFNSVVVWDQHTHNSSLPFSFRSLIQIQARTTWVLFRAWNRFVGNYSAGPIAVPT